MKMKNEEEIKDLKNGEKMTNPNYNIILARKIFKTLFEEDESFRYGYQSNIAMLLNDKYDITDHELRNEIALDIMDVIFDGKEFKKKKVINSRKISRFEIMDI